MNKTFVLVLLISICLGGLSAFLVDRYTAAEINQEINDFKKDFDFVPIVVAARDLYPGDIVSAETVQVREAPVGFVNYDVLTPDNWVRAKNLAVINPIGQGEPVTMAYLSGSSGVKFSDSLADKVAVTLDIDSLSSFSGMLNPSDRVDILMTTENINAGKNMSVSEDKDITFALMNNVEVIATGQRTDYYEGQEINYDTVTLKVLPEEAAKLIHAQKEGDLRFILKGPAPVNQSLSKSVTKFDLFGENNSTPIQLILGGS